MMADLHQVRLKLHDKTVEYLEDLLARAKSGEIRGFAIVIHKCKATTANGWVNLPTNCMSIIGELEAMKMDLINSHVDQRYDCQGELIEP